MDNIDLNGRQIRWDLLMDADPLSEFEEYTLQFLSDWKSGRNVFTVNTSGSTGTPKPVEIQRRHMTESAVRTIRYLNLSNKDHSFVCMNTSTIAGMMMLVRAMEANMALTIREPSSRPFSGLNVLPTFTALVPLQLTDFLNQSPEFINNFNAVLVGGAPVGSRLLKETMELKIPVYETYGMTETITHIALKRISGDHPQTTFQVLPGISVRQNAEGCLEINGDVTGGEWISTNDEVRLNPGGSFKWLGRKDHVINSGGVKIHAEKVEKKLEEYFAENNLENRFFIAPRPDERLGQCVSLFIEGPFELTDQQLTEAIRYRVDPYERPRKIIRLDRFDETPSGKINRRTTMARTN